MFRVFHEFSCQIKRFPRVSGDVPWSYPDEMHFSVSCDTHFVHKAWHDTSDAIGKINYPMLADPVGVLARGFDVMIEDAGIALRGTFLVNPEGIVKVAEIHDNGIGRSAKDMVRKLKAAKYVAEHDGEVCPAAWEEGQETLKPSLDLVGKI